MSRQISRVTRVVSLNDMTPQTEQQEVAEGPLMDDTDNNSASPPTPTANVKTPLFSYPWLVVA